MLRSVLTFFSTLAIAVMTAAAIAAIMPWLSGRTSAAVLGGEGGLHFESLILVSCSDSSSIPSLAMAGATFPAA